MRILVFNLDKTSYQVYHLPAITDGNYWVTYEEDGVLVNYLNVYSMQGVWVYKDETGNIVTLSEYKLYTYKGLTFYTLPSYTNSFKLYNISTLDRFNIGDASDDISFSDFTKGLIQFVKQNGRLVVASNRMYINGILTSSKELVNGDYIFVDGLEIVAMGGYISISNPDGQIRITNSSVKELSIPLVSESTTGNLDDISIFNKEDYFYRSPRFRNIIRRVKVGIDPPPSGGMPEEIPFLLQGGSMLLMGMTSMFTLFNTISRALSSGVWDSSTVISLVMGIAMLCTMLVIPTASRIYNKKRQKKKEKFRRKAYTEYLNNKRKQIANIIAIQEQKLKENSVSLEQCVDIIAHHRRNLWERKIDHDDFLQVHLGVGDIPALIDFNIPEEHFSLASDDLREELNKLYDEPKLLKNSPVNYSFVKKNITAILGKEELIQPFFNNILLQLFTFHSYEDLKVVVLTNKKEMSKWEDLKMTPYVWNNDRSFRYYAETTEEKFKVCNELNTILEFRRNNDNGRDNDYRKYLPYYLVITDDFESVRDYPFIHSAMNGTNVGFSFLIINRRLMGLPNECNSFINVDQEVSGILENELSEDKQQSFRAEFLTKSLTPVYRVLENIPIQFNSVRGGGLPKSISFLEMYNAGRVEQLNILNRWQEANSVDSLAAPIGVDGNGNKFYLDLHEKAHGPHGLIAGMTGSGKSEFIITYILSMALNYRPDDVNFVLIDYKGGGLALAFQNKELGIKLPHLAGTITNLDKSEINRSLASINSELRRRQELFNKAREETNESTIDIYKYQKLYHKGIIKEPIPHLFIISDEFAELKSQQPDFMNELISTARIGRSLGVHLILATQKPSGVVDAQIWSNSKFRVCLKVQDRSDSMDMIKVPDAAALSNVGRFYLQVGYNEFFAMGQSAWCGAPYYEMDERKKQIDDSLDYINNLGETVRSIEQVNEATKAMLKGEELPAILKYICDSSKKLNISTRDLWLPSLEEKLYVLGLEKKYDYKPTPYKIDSIVGEYDYPSEQKQGALSINLSDEGSALIYGSAGSGKENFLMTFIYSTIINHTPSEVNFYIMDFGAETLINYQMAPHVGDVILSSDTDKVVNLFKMVNTLIEERKRAFVSYGGNYNDYIKASDKKVPNIVICINNYDNFKELYPNYDEIMSTVTRDSSKYGIYFVITGSSSNSVRLRINQNFKSIYCLQMNNSDEYSSVLGNVRRMVPSEKFGRGLTIISGVPLEFQTAYAYETDNLTDYIRDISNKLASKYKARAGRIPVLPDNVFFRELNVTSSLNNLVVGIEKESLGFANYNLSNQVMHVVTSTDIESSKPFIRGLIESLGSLPNNMLFVADPLLNLEARDAEHLYQADFPKIISGLNEYLTKLYNDYVSSGSDPKRLSEYMHVTLVINGLDSFASKINPMEFEEVLKLGNELKALTVIAIDGVAEIKKHEYDNFYKNYTASNQGIFVGPGVADQYLIKLSKTPRSLYEDIPYTFGYVIVRGVATCVKLLEGEKR